MLSLFQLNVEYGSSADSFTQNHILNQISFMKFYSWVVWVYIAGPYRATQITAVPRKYIICKIMFDVLCNISFMLHDVGAYIIYTYLFSHSFVNSLYKKSNNEASD